MVTDKMGSYDLMNSTERARGGGGTDTILDR